MHATVASRPLAQDADGKTVMTLEEFKEGMFMSLRDNGTVERMRAQLRRSLIAKLRHSSASQGDENDAGQALVVGSTPNEKLVNGLVVEYLTSKGLENTLAVFVPDIGGSPHHVDTATILQLLHVSSDLEDKWKKEPDQSLLLVLVQELTRRFQLATLESGTQTVMACVDHRNVLDHELRRVETAYLAQCAAQELAPQQSFDECMIQYQQAYDDICNQRLQEEVERIKSTELALVRADERKRYTRELDHLQTTMLHESRVKQERLQERERDLELAFVARRTELETSLFETRQALFQDRERLRGKESELHVKVERDCRHFANETQRLQAWEESIRTQKSNLEGMIALALREKERAWQLERQQTPSDVGTNQDAPAQHERALAIEAGTLQTLQEQVRALQQQVAVLEPALLSSKDKARNATSPLAPDRQTLEQNVAEFDGQVRDYKTRFDNADMTNTRVTTAARSTKDELDHCKQKMAKMKAQLNVATTEIQSLQQQLVAMKLEEANAMVARRKKVMQMMDEERDHARWKENELLANGREMASRLAATEALAEKFQRQYEEERVQVEALRHDVSSLNSLLAQAQATITSKQSVSRERPSVRAFRSLRNNECLSPMASEYPLQQESERSIRTTVVERSHARSDNQFIASDLHLLEKSVGQALEPMVQDQDDDLVTRTQRKRAIRKVCKGEPKHQVQRNEEEQEEAEQQRRFEVKLAQLRQERFDDEHRVERQPQSQMENKKLQVEMAQQGKERPVRGSEEVQKQDEDTEGIEAANDLNEDVEKTKDRANEWVEVEEDRAVKADNEATGLEDQEARAEHEATGLEDQEARAEHEATGHEDQETMPLPAALPPQANDQRDKDKQYSKEDSEARDASEAFRQQAHVDAKEIELSFVQCLSVEVSARANERATSKEWVQNEVQDDAIHGPIATEQRSQETVDPSCPLDLVLPSQGIAKQEIEDSATRHEDDERVIDGYRQRVMARQAARHLATCDQDAPNEVARLELHDDRDSMDELELSSGSFAASSAASTSDSF